MEELTALATKHLGKGQKASSCPSCNRKLMDQLKSLVKNAEAQTRKKREDDRVPQPMKGR